MNYIQLERKDEANAKQPAVGPADDRETFNGAYEGTRLSQIAFPMGGIGAGMVCLEGTGALSKFSLRNRPDLTNDPRVFAALSIKGSQNSARVLEGQVPQWKLRPQFSEGQFEMPRLTSWGLPRFRQATFEARFPFASVHLKDNQMPVEIELTGWSPFAPGDADNSSLPVAGLEYTFANRCGSSIETVFSFNAENFMAAPSNLLNPTKPLDRILSTPGGFVLYGLGAEDQPWNEGYWAAWVEGPEVKVNHAWFRDGIPQFDSLPMAWNDIESGACYARDPVVEDSSPGASLFVPFTLAAGQTKTITVFLAWYVPKSNLFQPRFGFKDGEPVSYERAAGTYQPWYAGRFASIDDVIGYWKTHYQSLRHATATFSRAFYDSTLLPEVIESVAANLSILKSPTVLRQTDGRLWCWEGCNESIGGGGYGTTTHVWSYAQAVAHLFPDLERSLRETEFGPNQDAEGRQDMRAALPIRPKQEHAYPPAADGQLGGIIKVYRDWRISGNTAWLRSLWPKIGGSLDYCIRTWDPQQRGWIEEPHLNTYDVEFWGADSMCTSLYLGALKAAVLMGTALHENTAVYEDLLARGIRKTESELFNGEYFIQHVEWKNLRAPFPPRGAWLQMLANLLPENSEGLALVAKEGPKYQYGYGCLSDGMLGAWLSFVCGVDQVLDGRKIESHLTAVYRHNFKNVLANYANLFRAVFACGDEAGLLLCTWPRGGRPSLPFMYADEVWTGIEYQVASHLIALGKINEGLDIVRSCRRRYDGRVRNPFAEVEAGHWYARALSSYALLQAFSGARFDAVEQVLYLRPPIKGDFRCFLSTATGYGTVGVKNGQPFIEVVSGEIPYRKIDYTAA
jgi:uncharacterized protein (DUF608 family)